MSNPIDGAGGPGGPDWTEAAEEAAETKEVGEGGFEAVLNAVHSSEGGDVSLDDLEAAVTDVAQMLSDGGVADPSAAIELVIDKAISLRTDGLGSALEKRIAEDLKGVLMADPYFVLEVEGLIAHSLSRLS